MKMDRSGIEQEEKSKHTFPTIMHHPSPVLIDRQRFLGILLRLIITGVSGEIQE